MSTFLQSSVLIEEYLPQSMTSADSTAIVLYSLSLRSIWVLSNDIPVAYAIFFCLLSRGKSMVKGLKKKQKKTS